jgi:group I intron endonuclease
MSCVYVLYNCIKKKAYVGQTTREFEQRLHDHQKSRDRLISKAIQKYGIKNFAFVVIETNELELDAMECQLIQSYNSLAPNGYNLESGGHINKHHSEITKAKSRVAHENQIPRPAGWHHTEHAKQKISKMMKGRSPWTKGKSPSKETRDKISLAKKGHPGYMKGRKLTTEQIAKMKERRWGIKSEYKSI